MSNLVLKLPVRTDQKQFNLLRWEEVSNDPQFQSIEGRIETDRHGHIVMSPPPSRFHGNLQFKIAQKLHQLMPDGEIVTECPISTEDGVKAADIGWLSGKRSLETEGQACLEMAPEICVEVVSPSNTEVEMKEKAALYLDAGALEVWLCEADGRMRFLDSSGEELKKSDSCPEFPSRIQV